MNMLEWAGRRLSKMISVCAVLSLVAVPVAAQPTLQNPAISIYGNEQFQVLQGYGYVSTTPSQVLGGTTANAPAATIPTGAEMFPCVQGAVTKGCTVSQLRQRPLPVARVSLTNGVSQSSGGPYTFFGAYDAPADYDGVQLIYLSNTVDTTDNIKFSIMPSASRNDGVNALDGSAAAITPTAVTWGTTSIRNPRASGGVATTTATGASGTGIYRILGQSVSDIMPVASLPRTDTVGARPLLFVRSYGTLQMGVLQANVSAGTNPLTTVRPDLFCGYIGGTDYTATAGGVPAISAGAQAFCPAVEVIFYLRGQRVYTIAAGGDSIDQGWAGTAAVNASAGYLYGWPHQLAELMVSAGTPAAYTSWNQSGQSSLFFNEHALSALYNQDCAIGVTHHFFKPYSTNEGTLTPTQITADLKRVDHVLDMDYKCGITPVLVYLWAGEGVGSATVNAFNAYIDAAKARGVATFDARALVSADGSTTSNTILPACVTLNSSGVQVDAIHLNAACQTIVAKAAFAQRATFNLP